MVGFKHTLCALLLTIVTGVAIGQNNTNSPYTRYGFGDLSDQNFGNSKAMGGIAFGLRDGAQINFLNPASYTAIDSLTFLFEGGLSLQNTNVNEGGVKVNAKNASFDYLAMQFRLAPWMAMSVGLLPFSNVGYSISDNQTTDNGLLYGRSFTGDGGLHQLYAGFGVKVLDNLSVGVNASYFWGDITRTRDVFFPATASYDSYRRSMITSISDYKLDLGVQYTRVLDKKNSFTIGAVFSPKRNLNNDYTTDVIMGLNNNTGGQSYRDQLNATFELPNSFGIGFTYKYDNRLTLGADYSFQQWSKANFDVVTDDENVKEDYNETFAYTNRSKVSVGAEFIPNLVGRSYVAHVKYRLGAYYSTPYYKIGGKRASREYGVTAGFGLPVPRSRSILSISGQFVRIKGLETSMVSENIFRLSIGLTFNERWFFKRRVE